MALYLGLPKIESAPRRTLHELLDVTLKCQFLFLPRTSARARPTCPWPKRHARFRLPETRCAFRWPLTAAMGVQPNCRVSYHV